MAGPERTDYGIDRRTFLVAWETSESTDEVYEKLAEKARELGLDPMPKPVILSRASSYRDAGLNLQKFRPGRRVQKEDLTADQELIRRLRAEKAPEASVDPALVDAVIKEIVRRLSRQ